MKSVGNDTSFSIKINKSRDDGKRCEKYFFLSIHEKMHDVGGRRGNI